MHGELRRFSAGARKLNGLSVTVLLNGLYVIFALPNKIDERYK
jgi:hypothetical protein